MKSVFGSPDLAVDLGTATTRIAGGHDGVRLHPSSAANVRALDRGVIVNLNAATEVLRSMMRRRRRAGLVRHRVLACAPTDVTPLERNAVRMCVLEAGASSVIVVPEPLAAAVGSGIDVGSKYAKFMVDFGNGVTDCAIIREGRIVASMAERVGCSDLVRVIQSSVQEAAGFPISEDEAERILRQVGLKQEGEVWCRGHLLGESQEFLLPIPTLHEQLASVLVRMMSPIKSLLREIPDSIGAEVIEDGIFLTGGGALLPGMRDAVAANSAIVTRVVADPLGAVICGARRMLPVAATMNLWKTWERGPCRAIPSPSFSPAGGKQS